METRLVSAPPGDTDLTQLKLEGLLRTLHQLDKQGYL